MIDEKALISTFEKVQRYRYVPMIKELYHYYPFKIEYKDFFEQLTVHQPIAGLVTDNFFITRQNEDYRENLEDVRNQWEIKSRREIKMMRDSLRDLDVAGLFYVPSTEKGKFLIIGSDQNREYIIYKIKKRYKHGISHIQYLLTTSEIQSNDQLLDDLLFSFMIINRNKLYESLMGNGILSFSNRYPNLPLNMFSGIRYTKSSELEYIPGRKQIIYSKIIKHLGLLSYKS